MSVASKLPSFRRAAIALLAACSLGGVAAIPAIAGPVATSDDHSCAIQPSGRVVCWGGNAFGELGDGTLVPTLSSVEVAGLSDATSVAVGASFSCALKADATVVCWGAGSASVQAPIRAGTAETDIVRNFTAVAANDNTACALRQGGLVRCWHAGSRSSIAVAGVTGATSIALDSKHLCAARAAQPAICVGVDGTRGAQGTIAGTDGATVIAESPDHVCWIVGGEVRCSGLGRYGELGGGDKFGTATTGTPVTARGIHDAVDVQTGWRHTCALRRTGMVLCWGYGADGQTGRDPARGSLTPVTVPGLTGVTGIAAYGDHTCATTAAGTTSCWGTYPAKHFSYYSCPDGRGGQTWCYPALTVPGYQTFPTPLGPPASPRNVPSPDRPATGLTDTAALSAGGDTTCAATSAGTVSCWGRGYNGNGTVARSFGPNQTATLTGVASVSVSPQAGSSSPSNACAVRTDGTVACWGSNFYGQSSRSGASELLLAPVTVRGVTDVVDVAVGRSHACALLGDGRVDCWGDDNDVERKTASSTVTDAVAISAGDSFTCVLLRDHQVGCWGLPSNGRLGRSGSRHYGDPALRLTDAVAISAHGDHACALRANAKVACWGADGNGQVGAPTPADGGLSFPHTVPGLTDAVAIGTGQWHSCAVRRAGTVVCWGRGAEGQLGNSSTADTGGRAHTCATRRDHSVVCWGTGDDGQLGDGTPYPASPTLTGIPKSIVPTLVAAVR